MRGTANDFVLVFSGDSDMDVVGKLKLHACTVYPTGSGTINLLQDKRSSKLTGRGLQGACVSETGIRMFFFFEGTGIRMLTS
jgi:hypothetical protein